MANLDQVGAGQQTLPAELQSVALVDATTAAATGGMSTSWWQAKVREGDAPAPAFRAPKCTRWRVSDVRAFWLEFSQRCAEDTATTEGLLSRNRRGSAAAAANKAKREASTGVRA